jgi:hypothetical protein
VRPSIASLRPRFVLATERPLSVRTGRRTSHVDPTPPVRGGASITSLSLRASARIRLRPASQAVGIEIRSPAPGFSGDRRRDLRVTSRGQTSRTTRGIDQTRATPSSDLDAHQRPPRRGRSGRSPPAPPALVSTSSTASRAHLPPASAGSAPRR